MQRLRTAIHAFLGVLALAGAIATLVAPGLALRPEERSAVTAHLVREQAAGFAFIGFAFLWCALHPGRRRPIHVGLLAFTALFAGVHWLEWAHGARTLASPLVNSVPFALLAATIPPRSEDPARR